MLALSVGALALPIGLRLQTEAQAAAPRIAVPGEVSPIRPIDFALGFREIRAEAAFYQGMGRPAPPLIEESLRPAPAPAVMERQIESPVPVVPEAAIETPAPETAVAVVEDPVADPVAPLVQPEAMQSVVELQAPARFDQALATPTSDEPPLPETEPERAPEPEPEIALAEVAVPAGPAPGMTPVPMARPAPPQRAVPEVAPTITEATPPVFAPVPLDTIAIPEIVAPAAPVITSLDPSQLPADIRDLTPASAQVTEAPPRPDAVDNAERVPKIAIVIAAAGLNVGTTQYAIETLPAGVTLAFAPIKEEATALAAQAKRDGHTVLVEIPLEPVNRRRDPGPLTLRVSDSPAENLSRLEQALARIPNADGASTYLGARFNADQRATSTLVSALRARNLFLFENEPTALSLFQQVAAQANVDFARGTLKIDRDRNTAAIIASLDRLEAEARRTGSAIGVGTTLRGTISTVATWAKEAEKRGVRLVPIHDLAR